jgi:asparagine synthase (glutamine-hydrolysing)
LDHRIVQLANALPVERKLHGATRKRVLLERLGHMLPKDILERPKTGFEMPTGVWLRGEMRSWAEDRLFDHADTKDWVNREALRDLWQTHLSGKLDCTEPLWFHIAFTSWLKRTYG